MNTPKKKGRPPKPIAFTSNNPDNIIPIDNLKYDAGESFDESDGLIASFTLDDPKIFASFLGILNSYQPVFTLVVTENGIIFQCANDKGLADVTSKLIALNNYRYHSSIPYYYNINISELRKKIPTTSQGEFTISIENSDIPEPHTILRIKSFEEKSNLKKNNMMSIENIDPVEWKIDENMNYDVILSIASQWFKTEIKQLKSNNVSFINLKYDGDKALIIEDVNPNGDSFSIEPSQKMIYVKKTSDMISCKYNLTSFFDFLKGEKISDTFKMYLSNQFPMILEYDVADYGVVQFFIKKDD